MRQAAAMREDSVNDTDPAADAIQTRIYRRLTGAERLQLAVDMSRAARALCLARLRRTHPHWTDAELRLELVRYAFVSAGTPSTGVPQPPR
jgi:hypothetical protein